MKLNDLAPWIAIAVTLILSILVPLFTQIANNSHQRKMQREKLDYEEKQKKTKVYEAFLSDVGAMVTAAACAENKDFTKAGSSLYQVYIYAPTEWHEKLDSLAALIKQYKWEEARLIMQELSRLISRELNKEKHSRSRNAKKY